MKRLERSLHNEGIQIVLSALLLTTAGFAHLGTTGHGLHRGTGSDAPESLIRLWQGVYTISFLWVMGLFAVGNILLKIKRSKTATTLPCRTFD
jgi:hypothetical protein